MAPAGIGDRVEGFHAVVAAHAAGRVRSLTIELQRLRHDAYAALVAAVEADGLGIKTVDDVREIAVTESPQGVIAECTPLPVRSLSEVIGMVDPPALLVVDRINDPRNLGAIARSTLAAGVPALVVPRRRSAPVAATAFKAAAGALEHLAVAMIGSVADAVLDLRRAGVWVVGLDGDGERSLFGLDLLAEPVAVVVGAEGQGLSRLVGERVDQVVHIPMRGPTESLNASVAASLAVFELARVRGWIE